MSYRISPVDGTVTCDTPEEAMALSRAMVVAVKTKPWKPEAPKKRAVEQVLADLCATIPGEPHPGRGPKPVPIGDVVFACAMKIYLGVSGRQCKTGRGLHYNTLFARMGDVSMTKALSDLLYVWRRVKPTPISWEAPTAKTDTAKVNEKLLRELVERATTMAKGER